MNKNYEEKIRAHYEKVAKAFGLSAQCTIQDPEIRKAELKFLAESLERELVRKSGPLNILDLGCGNGYTLAELSQGFPDQHFFGLEFSPELYELAASRQLPNVQFGLGCGKSFESYPNALDIIITERMLINILDRTDQYQVLKNIAYALKPGGLYLMVESFSEPLVELNHARKEMRLPGEITQSAHNLYLNERFVLKGSEKYQFEEEEGVLPANYLSTYFYITRVFHQTYRPQGGKIKQSRFSAFFAEVLPPSVGNYSPILFRAFRKK